MCSFLPTTELCLNVSACSAIHVFCILFVPCTLRYGTTVLLSVAVGFEYVIRAEKKKFREKMFFDAAKPRESVADYV